MCTAGPKAGEEFPLDDNEVVIGRAVENAVSVPDTSVSRRHAMLKRVGGGWAVSDLGSGNGTLVNGEPVEQETVLRNGDVLACGDTELTFADGGNSTDRRPVPRRTVSNPDSPVRRAPTTGRPRVARSKAPDPVAQGKKKRLMALGAVFLLLVVASMGAIKYKASVRSAEENRKAAERDQARAQIGSIFQEGKNLVRVGNWEEAKVRFEQIQAVAPEYPGVADYLKRAEQEIPNQHALSAAETALGESRINDAFAALGKVSQDTQQFQKLRDLRAALEGKVLKRVQEISEASTAAARISDKPESITEFQKVVAMTDDVLAAYPDHRDASILKEQAQAKISTLSYVAPTVRGPAPQPWEEAAKIFMGGDLTGAFAVANSCAAKHKKCQDKLDQMKAFGDLYKKMEDLDAKGLSTLLTLSEKITDGRGSKLTNSAGTRVANLYFKSASASKAAGQYGRALEYAQKALKADPSHSGATQIVVELRTKAKDVYLLGYTLKETTPDEAIQKFKEVMLMAPAGSEYYEKAKRQIVELGR
ncbi:MAG: FHA domain-containing protein [Myxococcota bacterium]|nr:FHA domain-containing protein [Myxococcota bacterium]